MSHSLPTPNLPTPNLTDDKIWTCDYCGVSFSNDKGCVTAGFGFCNSCIGYDWRKSINMPKKEKLIEMKRRKGFSDLEFKKILSSIRVGELIDLKMKYDKAFLKYWSAGGRNYSKFQPVSLEEFKRRLRNKDFFEK